MQILGTGPIIETVREVLSAPFQAVVGFGIVNQDSGAVKAALHIRIEPEESIPRPLD
jgi:hypothetical protein